MMLEWLDLCLFLVAVGVIGFIACAETALVGVPGVRLEHAIENNVRGAARLVFWTQHTAQVLTTFQWSRIMAMMLMGVSMYHATLSFSWWGRCVALLCASVVVLIFGHLLPRSFAKRNPLQLAIALAFWVRTLVFMTYPLVWPMSRLGSFLMKWMGVAVSVGTPFWTPDEIGQIAEEVRAEGLGKQGEDLLLSIIEFSDTIIREIMVPRTEMVSISTDMPWHEASTLIFQAGHSRVPVYEETIDHVIGVLHLKDLYVREQALLQREHTDTEFIRKIVRTPFFVPEVMKISELLREFQRRKTHMAVVVDEYGGTAGVVTLEDIIEEIVGDIQDEYDVDEKQFRVLPDNKIIADGRVSVWDLQEALGVEFPEDAGYETLAGFLMAQAGYLPEAGSVIHWNHFKFVVKEANAKRIGMVEIEGRNRQWVENSASNAEKSRSSTL